MSKLFKRLNEKLTADIVSIPKVLTPNYLPALDGLRGISILLVILGHLTLNSVYKDYFIGNLGVIIFFVISGFLITTLLVKEKIKSKEISLKRFYIRRALRILPVAFLFLTTLTFLNLFLKLKIPASSFLSSLFFIQNVPKISTYNWYTYHFWSLSVEEQFYLTFPFLLAFSINKYLKFSVFLILMVAIVELLGFNKVGVFYTNKIIHNSAFVLINLFGSSIQILIGSVFSLLLFKKVLIVKDNFFSRYGGMIIFLVCILVSTKEFPFFIPYFQLFVFPILIALVIILNLNENSVFTKILSNKLLVYIGLVSYSLYIWQQLFSNSQTWLIKINSFPLHVLAMLVVANCSYYLYERPFLKLKKRFTR
jgi:peptidoglycan/LPS O-acetylase OafA/YrhL